MKLEVNTLRAPGSILSDSSSMSFKEQIWLKFSRTTDLENKGHLAILPHGDLHCVIFVNPFVKAYLEMIQYMLQYYCYSALTYKAVIARDTNNCNIHHFYMDLYSLRVCRFPKDGYAQIWSIFLFFFFFSSSYYYIIILYTANIHL